MLLALGPHQFDIAHRALVMGIVVRTPDRDVDSVLRAAHALVDEGADGLDVSAVVTGSRPEGDEERRQVVPVVEALVRRFDVPICITTPWASVSKACYAVGAVVGNDVSGQPDHGHVAAATEAGASLIITHVPLQSDNADVADDLSERARGAEQAGIRRERIMIDAGVGLGSSAARSLALARNQHRLARLGWAVSLSASDARFLGDHDDDRIPRIDASHALGIVQGARLLRVHDVRAARRVADVAAHLVEARARAQHHEMQAS